MCWVLRSRLTSWLSRVVEVENRHRETAGGPQGDEETFQEQPRC